MALQNDVNTIVAQLSSKGGAQAALGDLAKLAAEKKREAEPFLVAAFPEISAAFGDKSKAVREAAMEVAHALIESMSPFAVHLLLPSLLAGIGVKAKPTQKESMLNVITMLAERFPQIV